MRRMQPGFTLLEVLGVILVTTILLAVAINFFINLSTQATRASENTREVRRAATILDRVASDLEHTLLVQKPADQDPLGHPWVFMAESRSGDGADRLHFIRRQQSRSTAGPVSDLARVAYTVHANEDAEFDEFGDDEGTLTLRRWSAPGLGDGPALDFPSSDDPDSFVLADDLRYFGFRFLDADGNYTSEWNSSQLLASSELPIAVEIQLALRGGAVREDEFGFDDQPQRHVRQVVLPLRPLNLAQLFDPEGEGDPDTSGENGEDGDNDDLDGLTLADCIDFGQVNAATADGRVPQYVATLRALAEQAGTTPFGPYAEVLAGNPAVSPRCR